MSAVRFDEATQVAFRFLKDFAATPGLDRLVVIRDLGGRFRFAIEGDEPARKALEVAVAGLEPLLGAWLPPVSAKGKTLLYGRVLTKDQLYDSRTPDLPREKCRRGARILVTF
jgi:hypothetical protein